MGTRRIGPPDGPLGRPMGRRGPRIGPMAYMPNPALAIFLLMVACEFEDIVTYFQMNEATGLDIRAPENRRYIYIAKQAAQDLLHRVFGNVRGVGYVRLTDTGIALTGVTACRTIERVSRSGIHKMECAEFSELSPNTQVTYNTQMTILAVVNHTVTVRTQDRVRSTVHRQERTLTPTEAMLSMLGVYNPDDGDN